jgi:hypothetical protein
MNSTYLRIAESAKAVKCEVRCRPDIACYSVKAVTPPPPPNPLPAACAECTTTLQLAAPGRVPAQIAFKMARSITGQMRIDYGPTSVISNPAAGVMQLLDHIKKEVRTIPLPPSVAPPALKPPAIPGIPGAIPIPATPAMAVKDLGIKIVGGIEVMGKQYTLPPISPPKPPAGPQVPRLPGAPALPKPPQLPMIAEAWISTKLLMPVLSRITGSFGQQMCHCKNAVAGEPPAAHFQVPLDYKQIGLPTAPAPPAAPAIPAAPAPPAIPGLPKPPKPPSFSF